jgi:class 3 adenylate cyclase
MVTESDILDAAVRLERATIRFVKLTVKKNVFGHEKNVTHVLVDGKEYATPWPFHLVHDLTEATKHFNTVMGQWVKQNGETQT